MLRQSLREDYTGKIGTLAKDEVRHMRNRGIVVVTLASRAAIRGGLLPEIAFSHERCIYPEIRAGNRSFSASEHDASI